MSPQFTRDLQKKSVALVYDHLVVRYGGAEVVVRSLRKLFPSAPIFTAVANFEQVNWIEPEQIHTSFLQNIPTLRTQYRNIAPLAPIAFESFDFKGFDIVISITAGPAKGIITTPDQLHVCYQLTPPRYLYDAPDGYIESHPAYSSSFARYFSQPVLRYLRWWDQVAAQRPDATIAISKLVAQRIQRVYDTSVHSVIYPPLSEIIDASPKIDGAHANFPLKEYLLVVSRLVTYKRIDLAITVAKTQSLPLIIAGEGVNKHSLVKLAGEDGFVRSTNQSVIDAVATAVKDKKLLLFLGAVTEDEKQFLLTNAKALLMPGIEDFGITGLEAIRVGTPVICNHQSGIAEVLQDGVHAVHQIATNPTALQSALQKFNTITFDPGILKTHARNYTESAFLDEFAKTTYKLYEKRSTI